MMHYNYPSLANAPTPGLFRFLAMILFFLCAGSAGAHVALDSPQGGESFQAGEIITIQWHVVIEHETQNWDLTVSYNGGNTWSTLVLDLPVGQLAYQWSVPYTGSEMVRIRVVQDNEGMDYMDESDNFTIVVLPPDGPLFAMQAQDITLQCDTDGQGAEIQEWLDAHGGAVGSGSCGELTWSDDFTGLSDSCGVTGSALVTFTLSDSCGMNSTSARLTVEDHAAPVLDAPAMDMVVECDGTGNLLQLGTWRLTQGGASASDACSGITWSEELGDLTVGCGSTGSTMLTFIASDACGNTSMTCAWFQIVDTTVPEISIQARDTTIDCTGIDPAPQVEAWLETHGGAVAEDIGSDVLWTHDLTELPAKCDITFSRIVRFTATDYCGNASVTEAMLTLTASVGVSSPDELTPDVRIFPNPAHQNIQLEFGNADVRTVTLLDLMGVTIWSQKSMEKAWTIPVGALAPGVYVLQFRTQGGVFVRSVTVD